MSSHPFSANPEVRRLLVFFPPLVVIYFTVECLLRNEQNLRAIDLNRTYAPLDQSKFFSPTLLGCTYGGPGKGDYNDLVDNSDPSKVCLLFCGNRTQDSGPIGTGRPGGGSASIRGRPNAFGIATGDKGSGYEHLTSELKEYLRVRIHIDLNKAIEENGFEVIIIPYDFVTETIPSSIYRVGPDVKEFILEEVKKLCRLDFEKRF